MIPKTKRAKVVVDLRVLPADLHWVAVQTAVNSALSKFKIKTKITIREEKPFLVVEATRKRSPKPRKTWESPSSFSCRSLENTEMVHVGDYYQESAGGLCHSIGSAHAFANQIVGETNAGGRFYRGIKN